jgi:F-box-like
MLSCIVGLVSQRVTIGLLPDDVLLVIFYQVYILSDRYPWRWRELIHVCRRWRRVVFVSPLRLELQLSCTAKTPVRRLLDIWPVFPLVVDFYRTQWQSEDQFDNLIAALERCDRIREIAIYIPRDSSWEHITTVMQEPFPALRSLQFECEAAFPLPDTFLNGSAPCLQQLFFQNVSFPSLPKLLSSATGLTSLKLWGIPNTGYISPEEMASCLSTLKKLEYLTIEFQSPTPLPQRRNRSSPPPTRFVLPALTELVFKGGSEYLEVLVTRIDAPLLSYFKIKFFHQLVFDIPQVIRFFGHLESFTDRPSSLTLRFHPPYDASIFFLSDYPARHRLWRFKCKRLDWQVFSVAQICSQILPFRSSVESLIIVNVLIPHSDPLPRIQQDEIDPTLWLQLFRPFTSVQCLKINATLEPFIAAALQGLTGESAAEVFPSLHSLSIAGNLKMPDETAQQGIQSFVTARQHSSRPVAVSRRKFD